MGLPGAILRWYGQRQHVRFVKAELKIGIDQFCKADKGEFIVVPRSEMTWREKLLHAYEIRRENKTIARIERFIVYACFYPHAYLLSRKLSKQAKG